jgi:long-chain acyl-CoA synthetase
MNLAELHNSLAQFPDRTIEYFKKNRLCRKTFPEVAQDAQRIADWMAGMGLTRGMRIGILAENCYEWVVYELACLQLGCVLITFPPDEFAHASLDDLAEQYGLNLMAVSAREMARRNTPHSWVACLDEENVQEVTIREPATWQAPVNQSVFSLDSDVFSLVFSSGTSGKLKCILMSKRGTEELVDAYGQNYKFDPGDKILVVLPLSNFQQRLMVYTAICYGFHLQVADPLQFFKALKEMRPSILAGPPAFYEAVENRFRNLPPRQQFMLNAAGSMVRNLTFGALRQKLLKKIFAPFHQAYGGNIRLMLTGAAPIRDSTLILFEKMGFPLYQIYGLTETGFVSWNLPGRNHRGSVGKLVFEGGVSLAEDGEIFVHYKFPLSVGYLNAEAEQAKTFLGARGIATGDIGRFDENGYLYIIGRKKQIIITQGGYKLQPEPIEREIEQCPEVSRAVLFGGDELPILVVLVSLQGKDSKEVRQRIHDHVNSVNLKLPPASRVGRVVFTSTSFNRENGLLTRNLKIDRAAVYRTFWPELTGSEISSEALAGRTA